MQTRITRNTGTFKAVLLSILLKIIPFFFLVFADNFMFKVIRKASRKFLKQVQLILAQSSHFYNSWKRQQTFGVFWAFQGI